MPRVDINMGGPKWTQMQQELIVARAAQEEADVAALKAMQEAARRERKAGRRSNTSKNKALLKGVIEGLVTVPSAFSHPAGAARCAPVHSLPPRSCCCRVAGVRVRWAAGASSHLARARPPCRFFPKMSSATSTPPGSNSTSPSSVGVPTMWGVEPSQPGHRCGPQHARARVLPRCMRRARARPRADGCAGVLRWGSAAAAPAASAQAGWTPSLHQHVLHLNVNRGA